MVRAARAPVPLKPVPLKTVHTYPTKTGNASLSIFSYPQRVPTFMGGSYERGWGPLAGTVDIQVTEPSGDRINAIKLTLTATQTTTVPKTASTDAPSALDRMAIDPDETKTKEVTLLQLEQVLFEPLKTGDADYNLLPQGKHSYPFSIELPLLGNKEKKNAPLLPPSCVIEPLILGPSEAKARQASSGIFGKSKGKDVVRPAWVTVKYQLKLTVQRSGLLKRNLRSYAPFVYLPPPPTAAASLLLQRRALGASMAAIVLQRQGDGCQPIETPEEWRQRPLSFLTSPNGPQKLVGGPEKKGGFLSGLFSGPKKQDVVHWHEAWTLSMPMSGRSSFPLRSAIPFIVRCTTNKPIDLSGSSPLAFRLYRRVRLLTGKKQRAIAMQQEPVAEAALRYAVEARGVHRINGIISLPPNCVPNFEMHNLALDYYVAVVRLHDGAVLHKEAVNLACPPPVEPRTAYGPYPSGLAWREARTAALSPQPSPSSSDDYSPPLAPRSEVSAGMSPSLSSRARPSFSSMASSSSSSAHGTSRRTSVAPSFRSYRSGSTDSNLHGSAASTLSHSTNTGATAGAAPMGLAGMSNPPPASSAGASGLGYMQFTGNLDPVREQGLAPASLRAGPASSTKRGSQPDTTLAAADMSDTASIASSRRQTRYSASGAAPLAEAGGSRRSSIDPDAMRFAAMQEKTGSLDLGASSDGGHTRRGLFVTNAEDLPRIPASASTSAREQANALVGGSASRRKPRQKRTDKQRPESGSTSRRRNPAAASTSRPLPIPPSTAAIRPPSPTNTLSPPPAFAPAANAHETTLMDDSALFETDDAMYGEEMELDLPPSYFEAVHGAEEDDDG
ncbi:Arrestin-like, N-terminal [Kalmanozyma brasiliensis GHG001]|uniref:Arrestin-like, N-terminal n=1 Tax=Kalmanozyma brasiliensis (strain GHG001) TaxID=1365824 RepID=UPI00286807B7|nr:Arrestin-like, N-terminal [Kalmanozyma brasiliensis GHG001]EST07232.2 Arrestin-like, N-terminal [Kalmanozyma brasiliensis GHG001]